MATAVLLGSRAARRGRVIVCVWRQDLKGAAGHRDQHHRLARDRMPVRVQRAIAFALAETGSEDRGRPVTLAVTDFCALAFYFSLAWFVLG